MSQDQLRYVQQLIAEQRFDEARAILQSIDRPEVAQLLNMLDRMQSMTGQGADPAPSTGTDYSLSGASPADPARQPPPSPADLLSRLGREFEAAAESAPRSRQPRGRSSDEGTFEMLWDCQYCGTKKLLGKTHRFCPSCGAAQNPNARYFPSDDEKVAVEDHEFVGADKTCPNCDGLNVGNAEFCGNCGAPLSEAARARTLESQQRGMGERFASSGSRDVVKENFDAEMERVGVKPRRGAGKKPGRWLPALLIALVVLAVGTVALFMQTQETAVYVTGHEWQREIAIEEYTQFRTGDWCSSMPAGAYSISRSRRVHHQEQVPDGQDCEMVRIDNGDGTFRQEQRCTTRYRPEDVYEDWCDYTIDMWRESRRVDSSGSSLGETPYWPATNLNCAGVTNYGCEREKPNGSSESYTLQLRDSEADKTYTCDVDLEVWQGAALESRWSLEIGRVLGDARCGSLKRAG